jgi:dimethylhistidine N-methyltransferase
MAIHRHSTRPQRLKPTSARAVFRADALAGLTAQPKTLPCKYFYDRHGARLFDAICELPEYYPTRTELGILRTHAADMARLVGPHALVIEYGSGSSLKTRLLLDQLTAPAGYVPVDIARTHLQMSAEQLRSEYPAVPIVPVWADFTRPFVVPTVTAPVARRVVYFPGSTLGNFAPTEAAELLTQMAEVAGPSGGLLIGLDLRKERSVLEAAYNDAAGVTAAFNLNVLVRLNRELGTDFDLDQFVHRAPYNADAGRIEMHLISRRAQSVRLGTTQIDFAAGETIHTENSYKYELSQFADLARYAGWQVQQVWTDERRYFSVQYLTVQ